MENKHICRYIQEPLFGMKQNGLGVNSDYYKLSALQVLTQWSKKTNTGFNVLKTENYMYFRFSDAPVCLVFFLLNVIPFFFS